MRLRARFIPTKVHAVMDWGVALLLLASPWLFQFDMGGTETIVPIALGASILTLGLFTDHEFAVSRAVPIRIHLAIDLLSGLFLATSPWLFGFAHFVSRPHLIIGLSEVAVALLTSHQPTGSGDQPSIG